jgi:hypothetical protein
VEGEQADHPATAFCDQSRQFGGLVHGLVHDLQGRAPELQHEPGDHRTVAITDGPDPDPRLLHLAIMPVIETRTPARV